MIPETVRATPRDNAGGPRDTSLAAGSRDTANLAERQCYSPASPSVIADTDEFLLDEIYRDLYLIESHAISAREACRRGDRDELRLRLRIQLRDLFRHAVELHNLISTEIRKGGVQ
jgi:hypothetical protein